MNNRRGGNTGRKPFGQGGAGGFKRNNYGQNNNKGGVAYGTRSHDYQNGGGYKKSYESNGYNNGAGGSKYGEKKNTHTRFDDRGPAPSTAYSNGSRFQ